MGGDKSQRTPSPVPMASWEPRGLCIWKLGQVAGKGIGKFLSPRPWEETCSLLSLDRGQGLPLLALASWCLQGPRLWEGPLVLLLFPPSKVLSFLDLGSFGNGGTLNFPLCLSPACPKPQGHGGLGYYSQNSHEEQSV